VLNKQTILILIVQFSAEICWDCEIFS